MRRELGIVLAFTVMLWMVGVGTARAEKIKINKSWKVVVDPSSNKLVKWAAGELATDLSTILQTKITLEEGKATKHSIYIPAKGEISPKLKGKWEHFSIQKKKKHIRIQGSDVRGTVFGIFDLAERLGISPWQWWADVAPAQKKELVLELPSKGILEGPSVQYRGIFLNDEDWGLHPWAAKTFEPEAGDIGPKTYEKIFQLLLRLKANTIWPAMHPCTKAFYQIDGNNEMAQKYHIVVGTSHCEPMLRNNVDEWDHHKNGDYNYFTNKSGVQKYWLDRVTQVKDAENIVTLGMRGIHDGHMHGGNSLEEKTRMVEKIINDQREMLTTVKQKPMDSIATTVVLYKEVLDLYNKGLKIPDDVTIMWCDDNHGYIRRLSNEEEQKRRGGAGVYYHLSYWGSPHDYLWLSTTQPGLIWYEMNRAYQNGAQKIWIANVGDIKPCEYNMELFLDMAWDINSVKENTIDKHTYNWAVREFGEAAAKEVVEIKKEYYRLASIRRPEFMGWSKVEPKTKNQSTAFNSVGNGNELQRRLELYQKLVKRLDEVSSNIPEEKQAAWFQLMEYPVKGAKLMNEKFLFAQLARESDDELKQKEHAAKSKKAFREIESLTKYYNETLSSGKWKHMMSMAPRGLNVFKMPEIKLGEHSAETKKQPFSITAIQGKEFVAAKGSNGFAWKTVEGLGYSDDAVTLLPLRNHKFQNKQPMVKYSFQTEKQGEYELQVRLLPTHVNERDQVITIQVDNETPKNYPFSTKGRSWQWKKNIFQNHTIVKHKGVFNKKGKHQITIWVNQTGIVIDQLGVNFAVGQNYYEIPVVANKK
ncbi:glycosyl hydrolase [Prolixibacteraceae bacterium JC049]|nr:glycosyl hydrolase [Prolixibacteraceae bacterium JC049]